MAIPKQRRRQAGLRNMEQKDTKQLSVSHYEWQHLSRDSSAQLQKKRRECQHLSRDCNRSREQRMATSEQRKQQARLRQMGTERHKTTMKEYQILYYKPLWILHRYQLVRVSSRIFSLRGKL